MSRIRSRSLFSLAVVAGALLAWSYGPVARTAPAQVPASAGLDPTLMATYKWRSIGPDRGGRSLAVAGAVGRPKEGDFGATGGGLWKTVDGGDTGAPRTDGEISSPPGGAGARSEKNTAHV